MRSTADDRYFIQVLPMMMALTTMGLGIMTLQEMSLREMALQTMDVAVNSFTENGVADNGVWGNEAPDGGGAAGTRAVYNCIPDNWAVGNGPR